MSILAKIVLAAGPLVSLATQSSLSPVLMDPAAPLANGNRGVSSFQLLDSLIV
jgi:hypothetical protein